MSGERTFYPSDPTTVRIIEGICKRDQNPVYVIVQGLTLAEIIAKLNGEEQFGFICTAWHPHERTLAEGFDWDPEPKGMTLEERRQLTSF